jgi:hypothetical protein
VHIALFLKVYFTHCSRVQMIDVFALGLFQELFGTKLVVLDLLYLCSILLHRFAGAKLSISTSVEVG